MKAAAVVNYENKPHAVEIREVEVPECGDDDVLLEVKAASVCGSDIHQWEGKQSWTVSYPIILGHEFGGVIKEVGKNVTAWKVGDRVVSETAAYVDMFGPMSRQAQSQLEQPLIWLAAALVIFPISLVLALHLLLRLGLLDKF